jgi:hypothetical protein
MAPFEVEPEYLALVDPATLLPVPAVDRRVLVAVARAVGTTRLIDNTFIGIAPGRPGSPAMQPPVPETTPAPEHPATTPEPLGAPR